MHIRQYLYVHFVYILKMQVCTQKAGFKNRMGKRIPTHKIAAILKNFCCDVSFAYDNKLGVIIRSKRYFHSPKASI